MIKNFISTHIALASTLAIVILSTGFSSALHAQTAPSTYSAYTGTDTKTIPPAPTLGPANSVVKDPTFGSQILRVTDSNTNNGESFVSTDAGFHRTWNANSTAIKLTGPHGDGYWLEFNPNAFTVGDGSSKPVIHPLPFPVTWEWSAMDPDIIYFLNGNQIAKYNKSTGVTTNLGGPPNGNAVTYMAVVISQDNWVCAAAGSGAQNSYSEIFCVNPITPSVNVFISVLNKTINGITSSDPNWPTSASGSTIGIHDISGGTGPSWLEVTFHGASWGGNGGAVFDLATNTWSEVTKADAYWSGHVSMGSGKYANSAGSVNGSDSRGMVLRNPDNLMSTPQYQFIGQPPDTLNQWCDGDHNSWFNSMSNPSAPILISRYTIVTPCQYAWNGEIIAAAIDGSNTVWRFAHNHNGGNVCYYAEAFAQISNDGHWALFSSYWDGTLGPDSSFGCSTRIDTFIVDLFSAGSSSTATPLAITTTSLASGTQNVSYSATLAATGGASPYIWSIVSGSLPAGLTLSSAGVISGTPTATGTSSFTVQVAGSSSTSQTATATLTLAINPPALLIATTSLPTGTQNSPYATSLAATGGTPPYTWSVVSASLPAGLSLASSSGAISGTPTTSGNAAFTVQVADSNSQQASATLTLTINPPPLVITTASLPAGTQNSPYTTSLSATGGTPPYTWSFASGSLPAGLSLVLSSGAISGTPTASGSSTFTVQVADSAAQKATAALTLTINPPPLVITTTSLPSGTQNSPYTASLAATGGTSPYAWSVVSGSLPAGLSLASSGVISGTPTGSGTSSLTVQAADANGQKATAALSLSIAAAPIVTPAPIALVQSAQKEGSGSGSISVGFPSSNSAGNLVIAFVRMSTTSQTVSVTDALGNTYTDAIAQAQTTDGHQVHVFYAKNIRSGVNTVTATFSSTNNHPWIAVYEYSGLDTTNPLDQTASTQNNGSVASVATTVATSNTNELVFAATGLPASFTGAVSVGTGYALQQQDTGTSEAANETAVLSSTQTVNASFNLSYSTNWTLVLATFKAAGGSTSTPPPPPPAPTITTTSLPSGNQNTAYSATLSATGGTSPYSWSVVSGALPAGLSLASSSGAISGTPTGSGTSQFTVQVVDANSQKATAALSLSIAPAPTPPPITLLQSKAVEGSGAGSISAAFGSGNHAGNLIIAFVRMSTASQTVTVTDTAGNVYTDAVSQAQTSDGHQVHVFYAKNIIGGANTVTASFSSTNNHPWLAIYEYSGLNTTNPLDKTASAQGNGTTANSSMTATTSSANELVFSATGLPASFTGTVTAGTGFTMLSQDTGTSRAANETAIVSSTGSFATIFGLSSGTNWSAVVATFKQ